MRLLATALAALFLAGTSRADDTTEFLKPENWEGLKEFWTLQGTAVIGKADKDPGFNTFFCSKQKYTDFELTFKVKLVDEKGNSGVQVRSAVTNREKFVVSGPQCDIGPGYWGSLYGENVGGMMQACPKDFVQKHVKVGEDNEYFIRAKGDHYTIKVNGATAVDADFPTTPNKKDAPKGGVIAFQLHAGGPMTVEFKEIQFKDLSK